MLSRKNNNRFILGYIFMNFIILKIKENFKGFYRDGEKRKLYFKE